MSSLKKNIGYQTLYQILNVGLPLITAPFLARVLGAEPLGIMSFTSSNVHYFTLFAMMGLTNYGTRSIAVVKNNLEERNAAFSQIFYMQFITTLISTIAYLIYMIAFCRENNTIAWIQGIAVLACFFDINWFFFGIEEFKITVVRSMIIRVASVALMLILVKTPNDLWIYAVLLIGSTLVSQVVLWFYLPKFIHLHKPNFSKIKEHISPNIKLFIPIFAMSVYHIMDKTMLGELSDYTQSGYYYNADKVINIPIGLLTGVGTVMLPRMSALAGDNEKGKLNDLFNISIRAIGLVASAMCCGIAAIANEFTPLFFGKGYDNCIILIIVLAPVLFVKGLSLISRNLYLIPRKMENKLTSSVIAGAVVNLIVNFILITKLGALGAVIGTLAAECVSCIWQYFLIRHEVNCFKSIIISLVYFVFGIIMFIVVRAASSLLLTSLIVRVIIEVLIGAIIYCVLCLIYWKVTNNGNAFKFAKAFVGKR